MRRKDREVTDQNAIQKIIEDSKVLHLGLLDEDYPYVVPMHYGYEFQGETLIFYMHSAKEGYKLDLIRKQDHACVEIENSVEPVSGGEKACNYGTVYASVIGRGRIEILKDQKEKIHALKKLMLHQTDRVFDIDETMAATVEVLKFYADSYTAKARRADR